MEVFLQVVQWLRIAFNAGDTGPVPGQGTKIPHAAGQKSPCVTTRGKPMSLKEISHVPPLRPDTGKEIKFF